MAKWRVGIDAIAPCARQKLDYWILLTRAAVLRRWFRYSYRLRPSSGSHAQFLKQEFPRAQTIIVLEVEEPDCVMELLHSGVDEFFVPPFRAIDILPRVNRLLERAKPEDTLVETIKTRLGLKQMVGESPIFVNQMQKIPQVAKFNTQVLILGETGTGKELCARAIHYLSPRSTKPFVPINCGAVPVDLV